MLPLKPPMLLLPPTPVAEAPRKLKAEEEAAPAPPLPLLEGAPLPLLPLLLLIVDDGGGGETTSP